ncbi:lysine transporter LysE [Rhodanobacter thiooxydans]|uniref:Lysine transporter LysE n=1 Tax=Rhodanobacter thiooxydans TaxID=416169 RepID=A0A154QEW9_9GAMM|nr:LysE family transporter [Rhodanobacter thiooxydans]EIM03041.1 lysine exporter protein LysE/YggA [Rhodanobacter thiooxydans LCS2]KZC22818.1 lysine transporter LysE [Rhodanobacter thiooxydans]MCW0200652.1 LysE family transporter [Rhodanobacter thiooxydans]
MDSLLTAGGLLSVAAITPGPNNLVVLRAAGHAGVRGALPAIAGIVCGGLLLFAVTALGAGAVFAAHPPLQRWTGAVGALYLAWLGVSLCIAGIAPRHAAATSAALPAGTLGLIGFQFLNPKSWVIVLTVLAAMPATGLRDYLPLAGLFVLIPILCLLLWAALGAWLARWLVRPAVRHGVDVVMGVLLVACALLLLIEP